MTGKEWTRGMLIAKRGRGKASGDEVKRPLQRKKSLSQTIQSRGGVDCLPSPLKNPLENSSKHARRGASFSSVIFHPKVIEIKKDAFAAGERPLPYGRGSHYAMSLLVIPVFCLGTCNAGRWQLN